MLKVTQLLNIYNLNDTWQECDPKFLSGHLTFITQYKDFFSFAQILISKSSLNGADQYLVLTVI